MDEWMKEVAGTNLCGGYSEAVLQTDYKLQNLDPEKRLMMEDACGSRVETCTKLSAGLRERRYVRALPGVCMLAVLAGGAPVRSQQPGAGSAVPVSAETHAALQQLIGNSSVRH